MANPFRVFLVPNIGLQFDHISDDDEINKTHYGPTAGRNPIKYKLKSLLGSKFLKDTQNELDHNALEGWMSVSSIYYSFKNEPHLKQECIPLTTNDFLALL